MESRASDPVFEEDSSVGNSSLLGLFVEVVEVVDPDENRRAKGHSLAAGLAFRGFDLAGGAGVPGESSLRTSSMCLRAVHALADHVLAAMPFVVDKFEVVVAVQSDKRGFRYDDNEGICAHRFKNDELLNGLWRLLILSQLSLAWGGTSIGSSSLGLSLQRMSP